MDRGVYVKFSGKQRIFYLFSIFSIFKVIWINNTKNTGMKKYVLYAYKIDLGRHH